MNLKDVQCPYCEKWQDINHDEGQGFEEDELHEQFCECEKTFVYRTSTSYHYDVYKANCLNGGEHKYKQTMTFPKECTKMRCSDCDIEREPTKDEWDLINDTNK